MDFNNLEAFLEVANQGSFSLAGENLHLTQPAVSKRIAALEAALNVRLFDRIGRFVTLTEAGRELLPRAQEMLKAIEDIRRSLSNLSGNISGRLTMGTSHHIGLRRLPPILKTYVNRFPDVSLDIQFLGSELACAEVARGELELAVVTLPTHPSEKLQLHPLWDDPMQIVISRSHALAQRKEVDLEQLVSYPAVLTTKGTYTREILEQSLRPHGLRITTGMATDYLETLMMMVEVGLGWGLLPETMLSDTRLKVLKFPGIRILRRLGAVTHRNRTLSNAAKAMLERCSEQGPTTPQATPAI